MHLIRLTPAWESAFTAYAEEWLASGERFIPAAADPRGRAYAEVLSWFEQAETAPPAPLMPATTLFLEDGGRLLGAVDIRHALNEHLLRFGGHIGYGVLPSARGQGYAERMVRMCFPFLRERGLERVLITCDDENAASARTIERLGGVLENKILEDKSMWVRRYWLAVPPAKEEAI